MFYFVIRLTMRHPRLQYNKVLLSCRKSKLIQPREEMRNLPVKLNSLRTERFWFEGNKTIFKSETVRFAMHKINLYIKKMCSQKNNLFDFLKFSVKCLIKLQNICSWSVHLAKCYRKVCSEIHFVQSLF